MAHIGVDLDGVVYDFAEDARIVVANHLNVDVLSLSPAKMWDFWQEQWGVTSELFWKIWFDDIRRGNAWFRLAPIEGSIEGLASLQDSGHSIHIVTSRRGGELNTVRWLHEYGVPHDTIHIGADKTRVNFDILIDDWERNWQEVTESGGRCFIWDQPWNSHVMNAERVFCWDDVLEKVNK